VVKRFIKRDFPQSIGRSLRLKVTLGIIIPMVLMLSIFTTFEYTRHRAVLLDDLSVLASYNGQLIEETLRHSMMVSDFAEVQTTLDAVGNNENFRVVYLLDTSGRVIFAPHGKGTGLRLDNSHPTCQPCHKLPPSERPSGVVVSGDDGQRVFRSMHTIENSPACSDCHDPQQRLIGLLLTDISVAPFEDAFVADLRENLLFGASTILVSAIIAYLVMGRLVIHRLEKAANALASFGSGNRDLRLDTGSSDEIGRLEADFNQMGRQIQAEELENQALSEDLRRQTTRQQELLKRLITAQEDERKRVARELHDELGQSLSGLSLHSEVLEKFIRSDPKRALEQSSLNRELIRKTTQQMYELILALRPSALDDLGLTAALRSYAERLFDKSGIAFKLDSSGLAKRLPAPIETALYRIFQEALSNIVRHAGADRVEITLARRDGYFEGHISDNGSGFDPEIIRRDANSPHGLGLLGMQERVAQCGGSIELTSRRGAGTRIQVRIPLAEADDE
jgi:signal transduction histidine kinase